MRLVLKCLTETDIEFICQRFGLQVFLDEFALGRMIVFRKSRSAVQVILECNLTSTVLSLFHCTP